MINYKFKEDITLNELKKYIDQTYNQHYANGKYQATDMIIDSGYGEGFCIGNIMKYAMRYGKKNGKQRSDLLKIIHYAMIALYVNDESEFELIPRVGAHVIYLGNIENYKKKFHTNPNLITKSR